MKADELQQFAMALPADVQAGRVIRGSFVAFGLRFHLAHPPAI
jgi:hypothetical protein